MIRLGNEDSKRESRKVMLLLVLRSMSHISYFMGQVIKLRMLQQNQPILLSIFSNFTHAINNIIMINTLYHEERAFGDEKLIFTTCLFFPFLYSQLRYTRVPF